MNTNYKCYINNKCYFGDLEIKFNDKGKKEYWLFTENGSLKVDKDKLCKCVDIKDKNDNYIYENDIVDVIIEGYENSKYNNYQFIVKYGKTEICFNGEDPIYLDGLYLKDFNNKSYLFSKKLIEGSKYITIVGNTIENKLKDF